VVHRCVVIRTTRKCYLHVTVANIIIQTSKPHCKHHATMKVHQRETLHFLAITLDQFRGLVTVTILIRNRLIARFPQAIHVYHPTITVYTCDSSHRRTVGKGLLRYQGSGKARQAPGEVEPEDSGWLPLTLHCHYRSPLLPSS
jgi:hypothetical protein